MKFTVKDLLRSLEGQSPDAEILIASWVSDVDWDPQRAASLPEAYINNVAGITSHPDRVIVWRIV